ncbi:mitochondrial phosphate carrier protein [Pseudozyma hubeiensis SY62]|uniref:Mitochondrial phosphate carrier protein n=1 Tax=Pseudozyma hubeiensis (strain SY62) TaxID=1305764 RepID=R9P9C1_PSEHS|nr:mitochondrial phosphate carrier protein [Pseudozyma hubeiensis SY62]GAC97944.1 mitochondrial phosphate carrier protein [Pseudozyma hubeiensis SY62]
MLGASSTVREQMAKEDPSKRQYLPLFANGEDKGWGNPLKTYAMPLDPRYFNPATADTRLSGGRVDQHTFAILGVWHNDPADAFEYFGHGPRVALYGFATALNAPRADSVLPKLDPAQGLSHDLYRVLSVHP